jgi:outer membrane protein assembly factor BamD (BamD/ComL family)
LQAAAKPLSKDSLATLLARNKYELGGLFYLEMNLPDSGLVWYEDVVTNHPTSPLAPRALYAMSEIYRIKGDSAKVDSLYRIILTEHERTEYALQVRKLLKMDALKAINDSSYGKYVEAESLLTQGKPVDAIAVLNDLITLYPHSQLAPKSIYTIGWIYENLLVSNDTAAVWYSRVEKEYPHSIYAEKVHPKLAIKADPKSASQFVKASEFAPVKKADAPRTARTLNQEKGKGQPSEQVGNDRNANRDDDENVDDNTDDDTDQDDSTADDPDDNN